MEHVIVYRFEDIPDQKLKMPLSALRLFLNIDDLPGTLTDLREINKKDTKKLWAVNGAKRISKYLFNNWANCPHWSGFRHTSESLAFSPKHGKATNALFSLNMYCGNGRCGKHEFIDIDGTPLIRFTRNGRTVRFKLSIDYNQILMAKSKVGKMNQKKRMETADSIFVHCNVSKVKPCTHQGIVGMHCVRYLPFC